MANRYGTNKKFTIPGRGAVSEREFIQYWNGTFSVDPVMQQIFREESRRGGSEKSKEARATARAKELGWVAPDHDWSVDFDDAGFRTERAGYFSRNADWIIPAAVGGATLGFGLAGMGPAAALGGGGGSAAGAGGATAALGPSTAANMAATTAATVAPAGIALPAATGAALGSGAAVAGLSELGPSTAANMAATTAATVPPASIAAPTGITGGGGAGVGSWLNPLLQYGAPLAGNLYGAHAQSTGIREAAEINAQYLREALAYEKEKDAYDRQLAESRYGDAVSRFQPYLASGQTANDRMAELLGLNPAGHGYSPPPTGYPPGGGPAGSQAPANRATAVPPQSTAPPETMQPAVQPETRVMPESIRGGTVTMEAPDGSTREIPAAQVDHWRRLGARLVSRG